MLTTEKTAPAVKPLSDLDAAPLSGAEGDALLAMSAEGEGRTKGAPIAFHIEGRAD